MDAGYASSVYSALKSKLNSVYTTAPTPTTTARPPVGTSDMDSFYIWHCSVGGACLDQVLRRQD